MIPKSSLTELKRRADIVATIGKSIPLEQSGPGCFFGKSPFSNEAKDRSQAVSGTFQILQRLEIGKEGDIFAWLEETECIGFWQVAHDIAEEIGITLRYSSNPYHHKQRRRPTPKNPKQRTWL